MNDEINKAKIHIRPKGSKISQVNKQIEVNKQILELKDDIRNLKKQVGRLSRIAQAEENILETYRDQTIILKLMDGSEKRGILKEITKFQLVVDQQGLNSFFYKSAVLYYYFSK